MLSNVTIRNVRAGSVVVVREAFGTGPERTVIVDEVYKNIKNGRDGIEYGDSWAYLTQIVRVVNY